MFRPRVLVVDDSVTIRRSLTDHLSRHPELTVTGAASSGRIALMKMPLLRPDVVALDIDMPEMDGLQTLAAIRAQYPKTKVIILSGPTQRDAAATLDALALGAKDYVAKPGDLAKDDQTFRHLADQLAVLIVLHSMPLDTVQGAAALRRQSIQAPGPRPQAPGSRPQAPDGRPQTPDAGRQTPVREATASLRELSHDKRVDIVAIGVSTGGPNALMAVIQRLSADFPVPILVVQHMPPVFTRLLADRINAHAALQVSEARSGQRLTPGTVWIAPGDFHMTVVNEASQVKIRTHQGPPEQSCRPSVDVLLRSVAAVYGSRALAVVMTGMGRDGVNGCAQIHAAGGQVVVQDEGSSVVWGMPGAVARAQLADRVVPLDGLPAEISDRVWKYRERVTGAAR
jgi:two-component system, chemotaxis family, protein-glutamate methylesterase/glutaminase